MITRFAAFRALLCLSTAVMMVISWPLWVSGGFFPRVPFVGGLSLLPEWPSWVRFVVTIVAMGVAASGFRWRATLGVALGLSAWMVLEDQLRLQPWMYQFLLMGFALAACPESMAITLCRIFLVALYFHSGLSKLDVSFVQGIGATLLATWGKLSRNHPERWPASLQTLAILIMPITEILVAIGLAFRFSRRDAAYFAVILHAMLLLFLGPLGLKHSTNVLLWNIAIAGQVVLLFLPVEARPAIPAVADPRAFRFAPLARTLIILAALLPFGERVGLWDTWPSFALYAAHDERAEYYVHPDEQLVYPPEIERHLEKTGPSLRLNINAWSLAERRAPVYPQGRALNGVAEALASRYRGIRPAHLVQVGRAHPWTGQRTRRDLFGFEAIRRQGDTYLLNAHPSP